MWWGQRSMQISVIWGSFCNAYQQLRSGPDPKVARVCRRAWVESTSSMIETLRDIMFARGVRVLIRFDNYGPEASATDALGI